VSLKPPGGPNTPFSNRGDINVQDFGARGDGLTDDTNAIVEAIHKCVAEDGGQVFFPPGTYIVSTTLTLYDSVYLVGAGKGSTILKVKGGSNITLLKTDHFDTLDGGGTNGGPTKFGLSGLTLDGNKASNSSGAGVQIYGRDFTFSDFDIKNCAGKGWYSSWYTSGDAMEARVWGFKILDCGDIGMHIKGPHDSVIESGQIIRCATQGLFADTGGGGNCLFRAIHVWGGGYTEGYYVRTGGSQFFDCIAEGATTHNVWIDAADAAWIGGRIFGSGSSDTATGLRIGDTTTGGFPSRCMVKTQLGSCQTLVNFNREGGNNSYELTLQPVATGTPVSGLPHSTSRCSYIIDNGASNGSSSLIRQSQFPGYITFSTAVAASTVKNNSIFLDSADNVLKQKNNSGTVSAI